ncbi:hypothetical protein N7474_005620 [Penicillium riverlandense]|uniref:uncharacterized protein n=1 Tax=Penicillium riverlandense TaxID=1903569 RepID=UPI002548AA55|nr:uncharacterized protein N7474_005620 [Penicillium riverlandense]KAJ5820029.1 hypothetical protein N7474_005620 [Penicillium riverlandense]
MKYLTVSLAILSCVTANTTIIPTTCFDDQAQLESYFDYDYPWGSTHNGAASMTASHAVATGGVLTLTSQYTGASDYAWTAGTVYAKDEFTVAAGQSYTFSASFIAPTITGTWPAFWLTAVSGWPPEIDMAEWKGDGEISFNTFNTSSVVASDNVEYSDSSDWHTVLCQIEDDGSGENVKATFYLDGVEQTVQWGQGYINQALYLIIDYQMEGSSGSPGPEYNTTFQIKDLSVTST